MQEAVGYFFCLEDRALLCRTCDVAIHAANSLVSAHRRFLLTGIRVGPEPTEPDSGGDGGGGVGVGVGVGASSSCVKSRSGSGSGSRCDTHNPMPVECKVAPAGVDVMPFAGGSSAGTAPQWHIDEFLGLSDFDQSFSYIENGSSKVCGHGVQCSIVIRIYDMVLLLYSYYKIVAPIFLFNKKFGKKVLQIGLKLPIVKDCEIRTIALHLQTGMSHRLVLWVTLTHFYPCFLANPLCLLKNRLKLGYQVEDRIQDSFIFFLKEKNEVPFVTDDLLLVIFFSRLYGYLSA